jgi:hypothetical protein
MKGREKMEYLDVDRRIILKWILRNRVRGCGMD